MQFWVRIRVQRAPPTRMDAIHSMDSVDGGHGRVIIDYAGVILERWGWYLIVASVLVLIWRHPEYWPRTLTQMRVKMQARTATNIERQRILDVERRNIRVQQQRRLDEETANVTRGDKRRKNDTRTASMTTRPLHRKHNPLDSGRGSTGYRPSIEKRYGRRPGGS